MNESLEALRELRENGAVSFSKATISFTYLAFTKRADIIEKALKEYEQYKAIEQELGIDLITLFKAISNGVWVKTKNDISKHLTVALKKRHPTKTYWLFYRPYSHVYLEDYGKTWALTREELEK